MSGVIVDGAQWERCCHCSKWVEYDDLELGYSPKWPTYPKVDLCQTCNDLLNPITYEDKDEI